MSYMTAIETMPRDLQMPMLKVLDAFQRDMREQLAVRREDFEKLEGAVYALSVAQQQSEARLTRLEAAVADLVEAQKRTEIMMQRMIERQDKFEDKLNRVLGRQLETHYRDKAHAYFGRVLRKTQVVSLQEIEEQFESNLDEQEWEDVSLLDLVVRGQAAHDPQRPDVLLAFEISSVIDRGDVERSLRRAALLRKVGYLVVSGVAGDDITQGALEAAQRDHVFVVRDGHKDFWEDALAAALAA